MSIFNTGKYLDDSIGSLLNQTISFEENIQLILVNDGSIDNSETICLKYKNKYPDNIIYVYKENEGLSSARNMGLEFATGKYINFLDPDDLWSNNTFKYVSKFFKLHPKIDLVAGRMKFFEARDDFHPLDYKFYRSRVIDLRKEYKCIHLSVASCFFRSSAIYTKKFVKGLISGEDTRFVNVLLLNKPLMGVLRKALYFYRKRADGSSIVQTAQTNDVFYFTTPILVHRFLLDLSLALFNKTLLFIEYYVAYDILFRMVTSNFKYLTIPKLIKYQQIIKDLLKRVDDEIILQQKNVGNIIKIFSLSVKHDKDMRKYIIYNNGSIEFKNHIIIEPEKNGNILVLKFIDIKDNVLHIEGKDNCWFQRERYYYYCQIGKSIFFPNYKDFNNLDFQTIFGIARKGRITIFDIYLDKIFINKKIQFYFSYMNNSIEIFPVFGYFSHIPQIKNSYYINGNFILHYNGSNLLIFNNSEELKDNFEKNYCDELEKYGKKELIQIREKIIRYNKNSKKKKKFGL
jgi:glycosyltransferase involved in cell wall biosynthesis